MIFAEFVIQWVLGFMIKMPGYVALRFFKNEVDLDDVSVIFAGLLIWILIGLGVFAVHYFRGA